MASEPNAGYFPPSVMQSVSSRVARLGGIFALALLEANAKQDGPAEAVAVHGPISSGEISLAFASKNGGPGEDRLSSAQAEALGIDPIHHEGRVCWIQDEQSGIHLGALVLAVPHATASSEPTRLAVELLRDLAQHEFRRNRELRATKALSARHVESREREQRQLAAELHDHLSQTLTVMRLSFSALQKQASSSSGAPGSVAPTDLAELAALTGEAGAAVRDLTAKLRPALLETMGLAEAIRREASLRNSKSGVSVQCEADEFPAPGGVSLAAFRIAQEGLANAVEHAGATSIRIRLSRQAEGTIHLEILDNGRGFDASAAGNSIGLLAIAERAEIAGGRVAIESSPGSGTRIQAWFPDGGRTANG